MSDKLSFLIARTLRNDHALMARSVPRSDLAAQVSGRRIALVGNARALAEGSHGPAIDAADLVVRMNRAPMPQARSHGTRTDWLALATSISATDLARLDPGRILWMSHKRKRLPYAVATSPGFYLHPQADFLRLRQRLGAPPSTGFMMIDLLASTDLASLRLYGFDFMASRSLTGSRTASQVPHDFDAEKALVADLVARDPRITIGDQ